MDYEPSFSPGLKTKIAQKGYINTDLLHKYQQKYSKDLIFTLSTILQMRKGSSQTSLLQIVSLEISEFLPKGSPVDLKNLLSDKKTQRSRVITNIMLPSPQRRQQIESIRSKMIKVIRKNDPIDEDQLIILLQVHNLLNFSSQFSYDVKGYLGGENLKELKQKLTSLKKMMGGSPKLELQEKEQKKKAYLKNLEFRQLMGRVRKEIKVQEVGRKLQKILQVPRNKKWIGCRFHKLLLQNNWNCSQIQTLSSTIRAFIIGNHFQELKNFKKAKSSLRVLLKNLQTLTSKSGQLQKLQPKIEESERLGSQELQSLISIDDSFSSASINMVMDEEIMEFEDSDEDFL